MTNKEYQSLVLQGLWAILFLCLRIALASGFVLGIPPSVEEIELKLRQAKDKVE